MKNKVFRTVGFKFDIEKFNRPRNCKELEYINKPKGGLWASCIDPESFGWLDFCRMDGFRTGKHDSFQFTIKDEAKIYYINGQTKFIRMMRNYGKELTNKDMFPNRLTIDWEKLSEKFDGLYIPYNIVLINRWSTRLGKGLETDLTAWDVDSLVVFNPDIINIIKEEKVVI